MDRERWSHLRRVLRPQVGRHAGLVRQHLLRPPLPLADPVIHRGALARCVFRHVGQLLEVAHLLHRPADHMRSAAAGFQRGGEGAALASAPGMCLRTPESCYLTHMRDGLRIRVNVSLL